MARLALAAALVLCVTACSSSKHSATSTATTGPVKSPIVVKTPVPNSQWRSPIPVKGTSSLSGKLTVEVLNASGKQIGTKETTPSDGRFSVAVPFTVKQLAPAAVLVHDEVDSALAKAVEPLAAVADRGHLQPRLLEPERRHLADRGVVLHEQHVLVHRSSLER